MAFTLRKERNSYFAQLTLLKKLFWLYFLLLVFEGALRKWVVPQLTGPLLVIRDPVSIWIIWEAYRTKKWPSRWSIAISLLAVLLIGLFALQITYGGNPFLVGLYGLRSYLLPFPVLFIMGENLDDEDLLRFARCTLWLLLPMCLLALGQYLTPPNSFLNRGAYEGAAQIGFGVGSLVRSSGTFSFAADLVGFVTMAASFLFYGMVRETVAKKWLLCASAVALILIVPTTGQRALIVQLAAVLFCVLLSALMGVSQFVRVLRMVVPILMLLFLVSLLPVFKSSMQSMEARFSGDEGGSFESALFIRTVQPAVDAIGAAISTQNLMGVGMGRGAAAVEVFLNGSTEGLISLGVTGESTFSHELMEMGPIAGGMFELFKIFLIFAVFSQAFARARDYDPLALLLSPLAISSLIFALLEQPSLQGFTVISSAFCIAAARRRILAKVPLTGPLLTQQQALEQLRLRQQEFRRRRVHEG